MDLEVNCPWLSEKNIFLENSKYFGPGCIHVYDHCWSWIMWIIIKDSLPIWWIQGILVISTFCTQGLVYPCPLVCIIFVFIQFTVPFKVISLIEVSQSIGGVKRKYPGKTTWHTSKQNLSCLTCGQCGARTYTRHSGEMIEWLSVCINEFKWFLTCFSINYRDFSVK